MHPAPVITLAQGLIGEFCLFDERIVINHADDGVVDRIITVNTFKIGLHHFYTTEVFLFDGGRQLRGT